MTQLPYKKAYYRGIPCYFNVVTNEIKGRNKMADVLLGINMWFDVNIVRIEEFPILVKDDE